MNTETTGNARDAQDAWDREQNMTPSTDDALTIEGGTGITVSLYTAEDGAPVIQIDTPDDRLTDALRVYLNDARADWREDRPAQPHATIDEAIRADASYVNTDAIAALTDRDLASMYHDDAMPTEQMTAVENEICDRLNISGDETEQGISYKARAEMDAWAKHTP